MKTQALAAAAALLAAVACNKPGVAPGQDEYKCPGDGGDCVIPTSPGVIQGSVVYSGTVRGDAVLLLFDTQALPPPDGTATSAGAVARVPSDVLFANAAAGSVGPFSAPFTFTQVPSGHSYQIRAFIDATHEFDPFFDFTQQPRAGDPVGGYGALVNGQPTLLAVTVGEAQVVTGVNVALTRVLPFDPPSFKLKSFIALDQTMDQPVRMQLQAVNLGVKGATFANAHFALELDRDPISGARRSTGRDGLDDVFPRVVLKQLTQFGETGEVAVDPKNVAIIPCRTIPTSVLPLIVAAAPGVDPVPSDTLDVLIEPFALLNGDLGRPLQTIPRGQYQMVVIEKSGQVWTVPNSLGDEKFNGTPYFADSQRQTIRVDNTVILPDGSVAGKINWLNAALDPAQAYNVLVQAYADDPKNPPPPLGAALPVRVKILPRVLPSSDGSLSANYRIDGLPPGKYTVRALVDVDGNFSPINLLQTPTKGDGVGIVGGSLTPASLTISHGLLDGQDVNIDTVVPLDPPAFELAGGVAQLSTDSRAPVRFDLKAKPLVFPAGGAATSKFVVSLVKDANGNPVDADGDGLPDVWPRVFLVKLDPADPTGLTQAAGAPLVVPAAVDPTPFLPALLAGKPLADITRLTVIARPATVNAQTHVPGALQQGSYKIVLINPTGQIWQIPNEAGPAALDPKAVCDAAAVTCPAGTVQTQSQGQSFKVAQGAAPTANSISGKLRIANVPQFFGAYVFVWDAGDPPPTGTPLGADYHSSLEFAPGTLQEVDYAVQSLPPRAAYIVTAVVDTRGDFALSPTLWAAAPGKGTVLGGATGGLVTTVPATGVEVVAAGANALPERPSFTLVTTGLTPISSDVTLFASDANTPGRFRLQQSPVLGVGVSVHPETAGAFPVSLRCSGGVALDNDFDSLPDVDPQIHLVKISPDDPTGLRPDVDALGHLTVIPAAVDPLPFLSSLTCGSAPIEAGFLDVAVTPAAFKATPQGAVVQQLAGIPAGRYQVVLVSSTGQVWRIPNELQPLLMEPRSVASAPQLATQGVAVAVTPASVGTGSISGLVSLVAGFTSGTVGNVAIFAFAAGALPPSFGGLGRPVASTILPGTAAPGHPSLLANGALPYTLRGLTPGASYVVAAMMDRGHNFGADTSIFSSPGQGAQSAVAGLGLPITVGAGDSSGYNLAFDPAGNAANPINPLERPMFVPDTSAGVPTLPTSASAPVPLALLSTTPVGLPFTAGTPSFHPKVMPDGAGGFLKTPLGQWEMTTKVVFLPLLPTQTCAPVAFVDPSAYCSALVASGGAGCTTGTPNGAAVTSATTLSTLVLPATCARVSDNAPQSQRPSAGPWRIVVVERYTSGATWNVPNEISQAQNASSAGQGVAFVVQ